MTTKIKLIQKIACRYRITTTETTKNDPIPRIIYYSKNVCLNTRLKLEKHERKFRKNNSTREERFTSVTNKSTFQIGRNKQSKSRVSVAERDCGNRFKSFSPGSIIRREQVKLCRQCINYRLKIQYAPLSGRFHAKTIAMSSVRNPNTITIYDLQYNAFTYVLITVRPLSSLHDIWPQNEETQSIKRYVGGGETNDGGLA